MNRNDWDAESRCRNRDRSGGLDADVELLAAYDEQLRVGVSSDFPQIAEDEFQSGLVPTELTQCLHLLERAWPRSGFQATVSDVPRRIGRFVLDRVLGHGGFGVVYLATDSVLNRQVALKVPRPHALVHEKLRERFRREARAVAALDHPNIVPIHETGEDGPVCYIAAAYCPGPNLAEWLKQRTAPASPRLTAALVARLADAVHYSHTRGILHRDLKPSNVMLAPRPNEAYSANADDLPFVPRLTDFGLAKSLEDEGTETATTAILGTPYYMAPEQCGGRGARIGPHTDVYSLGVMLYELLVGRPPFQGLNVADVLDQVRRDEVVAPRRLRRDVPRDLENVCLKCLEKEPDRRYATALELLDDLNRFLRGEPVRAKPPGVWHATLKWIRRRPAAAAILILSCVMVLAVFAGGLWHSRRLRQYNLLLQAAVKHEEQEATEARKQRARAEDQEAKLARHLHAANMRLVQRLYTSGEYGSVVELLNAARPGGNAPDLRGFEWHYWWQRMQERVFPFPGHKLFVFTSAYSPDGKLLVTGSRDQTARVWDAATGRELHALPHSGAVACVDFSPDGSLIWSLGEHGTAKLWDTATGRQVGKLSGDFGPYPLHALSPKGKLLATGAKDSAIIVWNIETGDQVRQIRGGDDTVHVNGVSFSPDGTRLATARNNATILVWDLAHDGNPTQLECPGGPVWRVAFSPDNRFLAVGGGDGTLKLWDITQRHRIRTLEANVEARTCVGFSPDGKALAASGANGRVGMWSCETGELLAETVAPGQSVDWVQFSPDCSTVALGGGNGFVGLWRPTPRTRVQLAGHSKETWSVAISPDGALLASGSDDHTVKLWDLATGDVVRTLEGHEATVSCVAFSPDGQTLASSSLDTSAKLWNVGSGSELFTLRGHEDRIRCVTFSPSGQVVATGGYDSRVILWDVATGRRIRSLNGDDRRIRAVQFSPDGQTLAAATEAGSVLLWDAANGCARPPLQNASNQVWSILFSRGGETLVTGDEYGTVMIWNLATGEGRAFQKGHTAGVRTLDFSPDDRTLASGSDDRTIRLWDPITGQELSSLEGHADGVYSVAFSPDGKTLASGSHDGAIRLWYAD